MTNIVLAILVLVPAGITFIFRSSGALTFLALCGGYVAAAMAGNDLADTISKSGPHVKNSDIDLLFLVVPVVLTLVFTMGSVSKKSKVLMQTAAALLAGALLAISSGPFLNASTNISTYNSSLWMNLQRGQSYIAAAGVLYSLILVWFFNGKSSKKHH